ncbi:hypothetical protein [Enterobacter hormaechei]|uniref:hypothetical protein n=1 Tax=Enterobacter hormaechei TaxID=158836 RepID=UPI002E28E855|nr:hypothetical protein [Enterobacter hormaechei]MED5693127.1 hypothetical protein [Enterobacter hormaechei]
MKERGMIFNGEMVRAILDGRKTQTRRIMKVQPQPCNHANWPDYSPDSQWKSYPNGWCCAVCANGTTIDHRHHAKGINCPFGAVGDHIWVREAFQGPLVSEELLEEYRAYPEKFENPEYCEYAADGEPRPEYCDLDDNLRHGWRPSIHMPRWASRIMLEITDVRVERLQDISEEDAKAEGLAEITKDGSLFKFGIPDRDGYPGADDNGWPWTEWERNPVDAYCKLWQSIYGEESWQANPWVWVIEFKVASPGGE